MFFSTVSDGQGKGSGVSKDLRLSKCLLSSLLFYPSWDSCFYQRGGEGNVHFTVLRSSNPVAAERVCLVLCPLFYTDRQRDALVCFGKADILTNLWYLPISSTDCSAFQLFASPPSNTNKHVPISLPALLYFVFFVFSPSRPAILAWCRLNKDVSITPRPESNLRLDDSFKGSDRVRVQLSNRSLNTYQCNARLEESRFKHWTIHPH